VERGKEKCDTVGLPYVFAGDTTFHKKGRTHISPYEQQMVVVNI